MMLATMNSQSGSQLTVMMLATMNSQSGSQLTVMVLATMNPLRRRLQYLLELEIMITVTKRRKTFPFPPAHA